MEEAITPTPTTLPLRDAPVAHPVNVGELERGASIIVGGLLALFGLARGGPLGLVSALSGVGLAARGVIGHCPIYQKLGVSTVDHYEPVYVETAERVERPASELYGLWRDVANLPRLLGHVAYVVPRDRTRARWVADDHHGHKLLWDAEIITDKPGELIAWRLRSGDLVVGAGYVKFTRLGESSTEVQLVVEYEPPDGPVGTRVLALFDFDPEAAVREDLSQFKARVEGSG